MDTNKHEVRKPFCTSCDLYDYLKFISITAMAFFLLACRSETQVTFDPVKLAQIDEAIEQAIAEEKTPGGIFWLEQKGERYVKAYGNMSLEPKVMATRIDAIYDAASITKIVATTTAMMLLFEQGKIEVDAPVSNYLDGFENGGKENITIKQLMTHTSGLRPVLPNTIEIDGVETDWRGYATAIAIAKSEKMQQEPGTKFVYSDINFILLGEIIQQVSGQQLQDYTREKIFHPLRMKDTGYLPSPILINRIAPTKWVDGKMLRGTANNPICRKTGGVHGHAGIFTTAADLARFARMILNKGELEGIRLLKPETVELMTSIQTPESMNELRGLGWDISTSYTNQRGTIFPIGGYGHTGFIGTSLWIDPFSETFVIVMCNRVHPDGTGDVLELRRQLGTLAAEAIKGFDFEGISGSK